MFIETEATPNPSTLKFIPGRQVAPDMPLEFKTAEEAERSPLAKALFSVDGVGGVFFGSDFITVTKSSGEWPHLTPANLGSIMEHFTTGAPLVASAGDGGAAPADSAEFFSPQDAETVSTIKELLESRVRPAVAGDGGDITFRGFRDGVVFLEMKGSCSGCPSSTATLKNGVQNLLKHFVPGVVSVEQI